MLFDFEYPVKFFNPNHIGERTSPGLFLFSHTHINPRAKRSSTTGQNFQEIAAAFVQIFAPGLH
jgi:hypothetical protein